MKDDPSDAKIHAMSRTIIRTLCGYENV